MICWLFSNLIVAQKKVSECQFYQEFIMNYWVYILNNCVVGFIKTHGSVSLDPRKQGTHKRSEYIDRKNKVTIFTYMADPNGTKFTMEAPSTQGRPHTEFEENSFNHFQDTSNQTFERILLIFSSRTLSQDRYNLHLAEIWNTYWGSKGKYQYQIWGKSDIHSRSYKCFYT